jgi:hypothetical protein
MNRQQWRKSKARKNLGLAMTLGLPLILLGFAGQIVVGSFNTVNSQTGKSGPDSGGGQLMNDPNQEVTGGILSLGGVSGLGGQINGNGGVSGSVARGSSVDPNAVTKLGVTVISFDGKTLVFDYLGIKITGHLTSKMQKAWSGSTQLNEGESVVLFAKEEQVYDGLDASDGETADIGEVVFIEAPTN